MTGTFFHVLKAVKSLAAMVFFVMVSNLSKFLQVYGAILKM